MARKRNKNAPAKDKTLDADAWKLHRAMIELVRVYQFRDRQRVCYYDISATQCYALGALAAYGAIPLNALAHELMLDKSTTSRMVDSLEKKGYVTRTTDPDDARALRISMTAKGRRLHDRILDDLYQETRELAAALSPDARRAAAEFISRYAGKAAARFAGGRTKENRD
jgi:MarR family 2-MHQ and catechol resistance regulon transcriptional repressor